MRGRKERWLRPPSLWKRGYTLQTAEKMQYETAQQRLEQEREMVQKMREIMDRNDKLMVVVSDPSFRTSTHAPEMCRTPDFGL